MAVVWRDTSRAGSDDQVSAVAPARRSPAKRLESERNATILAHDRDFDRVARVIGIETDDASLLA